MGKRVFTKKVDTNSTSEKKKVYSLAREKKDNKKQFLTTYNLDMFNDSDCYVAIEISPFNIVKTNRAFQKENFPLLLKNEPFLLSVAPNEIINNLEIVEELIKDEPWVYRFVGDDIRNNMRLLSPIQNSSILYKEAKRKNIDLSNYEQEKIFEIIRQILMINEIAENKNTKQGDNKFISSTNNSNTSSVKIRPIQNVKIPNKETNKNIDTIKSSDNYLKIKNNPKTQEVAQIIDEWVQELYKH